MSFRPEFRTALPPEANRVIIVERSPGICFFPPRAFSARQSLFYHTLMRTPTALAKLVILLGVIVLTARGGENDEPPLERDFDELVRPFLKQNCLSCHGPEKPKGKLDLSMYTSVPSIVKEYRVWRLVRERLEAEEMPPAEANRQPRAEERHALVKWIADLLDREAQKNAGDPGPVLARRLSNAELDYTIGDLTGVDIRPTKEFPVDPANEAGFDNSGESLAMSPALLKKYLSAARRVADHIVLKPAGFDFAPEPAVTETDRDKYCVRRITEFYKRYRVDYARYFLAAWRFQNRSALGKPNASIREFAAEAGLSAPYLATVSKVLEESRPAEGPLGELQARWRKLPADVQKMDDARRDCEQMRDLVTRLRKGLEPRVGEMRARGISPGSQPFVLWRAGRLASGRMSAPDEKSPRDVKEFCHVFPDAFFVSDRPPYFDLKGGAQGRPLSAGFHLMQGYFRDDAPLCELVLDDAGRSELELLWRELNFVTGAPMRQYRDFIFFERAEPPRTMRESAFDFARSEDKASTSAAKIEQLRDAYLAKARKNNVQPEALKAIETYFAEISAQIRQVEKDRLAAEPSHLEALQKLADRAYRRPLAPAERNDLLAFYRSLREKEGLSHEDAIRDLVTGMLLSPHFAYRAPLAEPGSAARPLSSHELASRLSYFLWSSMPDPELLSHAASLDLRENSVLIAQTRRMLGDARIRRFATEFAGNWLGFRRFEEHNAVDRGRFPSFTNELRQAMYEEPIRFFVDVVSRDRSVLDLLYGDDTFVNQVLAKHYGMPAPKGGKNDWVRIEDARRFGRGGLLPMAVFLTASSPGLRTSPVKRGYWVVRKLLGERIPPPPAVVPELPKDEANSGELSLPQLLTRHRADKNCASCHERFDSVGLVFEGFGPIGERRDRDLGNRPVSPKATFPDGSEGDGLAGLRRYIAAQREDEFLDNLCRELLVYALGRGLILSDEPTIKSMRDRLSVEGHRFDGLIETIVSSPQFLKKRGRDDPRRD
jgi:mono/diheme cytochrome c family protein